MDLSLWGLFILAFGATLLIPGPSVGYSVVQSINYGFRTASPAALGFALATAGHAFAVYSGVALLALAHQGALSVLKWLGVAYLLYLAYRSFVRPISLAVAPTRRVRSLALIFGAMLASFTNPKSALASFLIYPAFIDSSQPYVPQALILGITAVFLSLTVYLGYMYIASRRREVVFSKSSSHLLFAALYVAVAVALAIIG